MAAELPVKVQVEEGIGGGGIEIRNIQDERDNPSRCCVCLDVRLGTILIGMFYLVIHAAWLATSAKLIINHKEFDHGELKIFGHIQRMSSYKHSDQLLGLTIVILSIIIIVSLIYGASMVRSSYILPFFCLQVFDAVITLMIAATMISYAPHIKFFIETHPMMYAHAGCIAHMSVERFRYILVVFSFLVLLVKYYMMNVVWSCFKYCKTTEMRRKIIQPTNMLYHGNMDTMTNLPSYEEIVKLPPPPKYSE